MRLQTKLILAFSSIVILMAIFQSVYLQSKIEGNFENYIRQNEYEKIEMVKELLIDYYSFYGSFDQVQSFIDTNIFDPKPRRGRMAPEFMFPKMSNMDIIVADQTGIIIADGERKWVGEEAKNIAGIHENLQIDGKKIGELILYADKSIGLYNLEKEFIKSINYSILFSTIISVIIAILFGIFLSNKMTKPLEKLMQGIRHLTKGDTKYKVNVQTKDEFSRLAEAFNEMTKKIEENEEIRKSLVADVAHELRTPLSILRGKLESIQEGAIEADQGVILQLYDEVFRLTRLVNDLQQLSLAEAGKLPLKISDVNLNELIERVIEHFTWLAEEKNIHISFKSSNRMDAEVDADRITQVIINILGNALRHTPNGQEVTVSLYEDEKANIISISDSGQGIDESQLPYIFERFYRTDSSRSRDQGGTGLGLSIAKGFVEAHGGIIKVESEKGKGSTFTIYLPVK